MLDYLVPDDKVTQVRCPSLGDTINILSSRVILIEISRVIAENAFEKLEVGYERAMASSRSSDTKDTRASVYRDTEDRVTQEGENEEGAIRDRSGRKKKDVRMMSISLYVNLSPCLLYEELYAGPRCTSPARISIVSAAIARLG